MTPDCVEAPSRPLAGGHRGGVTDRHPCAYREGVDSTVSTPVRSPADRLMRRLLLLPEEPGGECAARAQNAFSRSMLISATRCTLTYVVLPILRPVVDLSGGVGPVLGIVLSIVSMVAIVVATRRFFAADHRWRWRYTVIGGGIFVLVAAQAVIDVGTLAT